MDFTSSTQTISWLNDRYREGTLIIKPPFQRKPVWTARQKCYLIESILLKLPVPEIYIQQTVSPQGKSSYAVVDGQQRIRTVLQFIGSETDPEEVEYNKFSLDKLPVGSRWRNTTFAELSDETKKEVYGYKFAVRFLNTDIDDDVRDMFRRLNKFLTPLNAQELRNATYSGPFVSLVERLADNDYWAEHRIVSPAMIRRMNDIEFASELLIGILHGPQGGSAKIVDSYYGQYEDYDSEFPEQRRATRLFEQTLDLVRNIFPNIKETRWGNKTDFYSLFVSLAQLLRSGVTMERNVTQLSEALKTFAGEVDLRLGDGTATVSRKAIEYVRAVEKGANDKKRRGDRHVVLTRVIKATIDTQRQRR